MHFIQAHVKKINVYTRTYTHIHRISYCHRMFVTFLQNIGRHNIRNTIVSILAGKYVRDIF